MTSRPRPLAWPALPGSFAGAAACGAAAGALSFLVLPLPLAPAAGPWGDGAGLVGLAVPWAFP